MSRSTLDRVEERLKHEKYMSESEVDMVLAVLEEELTGSTTRENADAVMHEDGSVR